MVIFLYGADSYRRNGKLRELVQSYKNKHEEIDLLLIDLEDEPDSWARARDFLNQPSLFLNSKVLIVREAASVEEKEWLAVLKRELETPKSFVLVSDRGKPPRKFGFLLKGPAVSQSFPELEGASLKIFLQKEAAGRGLEFRPEALERLYGFIALREERSWVAISELEKIGLLKTKEPISGKDLKGIAELQNEEDVSKTVRAINASRDSKTKLVFLEKLFLQKEAAAYVFNSLVYQVRGEDLMRLSDYDVSVKRGRLDYEEALLDFVIA